MFRKLALLAIVAAIAVGSAMPAVAKKPVKGAYESVSANAFWYSDEPISGGGTRTTVWYVGVFKTGSDVFSDLYEDVYECDASGETCTTVSSRFGYSDLANDIFTIDAESLTSAHIDAVYDLQAYDENWEPVGDPDPTHIVADWEGIGTLQTGKGSYSFKSDCFSYRERFRDANRNAEAYGDVDGMDLGETYDAWLSAGASRFIERSC
ncbi:MAG: hypothetical protein ACRDH9_01660 [Actinomycetota bacterium]